MKLTEQNLKKCISLVQEVIHLLPDNPEEWESENSFINTQTELLDELLKATNKLNEFIEFVPSEVYEDFKEGKLNKKDFIKEVNEYNKPFWKK